MTQEYTPTDSEILEDYMPDEEKIGFDARTMSFGRWKKLRKETFERWLAAHDAQICAEAWEQGFNVGAQDCAMHTSLGKEAVDLHHNPYKEQQQ